MKKCPYCFEILEGPPRQCPHCQQFLIDKIIESDYRSIEKKKCFFCGKKVFKEARICKYCKQWLDKVADAADDLD